MAQLDIGALRAVSTRLDKTGLNYAFTGGSIVNLLLDHPDMSPARPTADVDVIIEIVSTGRYSDTEEVLRGLDFEPDMREGAPMCRWRLAGVIVDIMPTSGEQLELNTQWFPEVLEGAIEVEYEHTKLRVVSPVGLLVTKHLTFTERGEGDYYGSHDLEDFITVVDGRKNIVSEVDQAIPPLRSYLIEGVKRWLENDDFQDALPGHLPADMASQQRFPLLKKKLEQIAGLALNSLR